MFDNGLKYVSVGHIPQYIIDSILEKFPEFESQLLNYIKQGRA